MQTPFKQADPVGNAVKTFPVTRLRDGVLTEMEDTLVVEEPLEIRMGQERFTVTMRTPGHDFELTRGLLLDGRCHSVGGQSPDIGQIRYCDTGEAAETDIPNIITVQLKNAAVGRSALAADADGGDKLRASAEKRPWKRSQVRPVPFPLAGEQISPEVFLRLPHALRRQQALFQQTGGTARRRSV